MNSMNARYFDVDNYLITSEDITGPWSKPVYLHSSGFDASIFHDKMEGNILSHLSGRQEKGTKNRVQSVWWSILQRKRRLWVIRNEYGAAVQIEAALKHHI